MTQLHHATVVFCSAVAEFSLAELPISQEVQDSYVERLGIDDARMLVHSAYQRPANEALQTLVVRTEFITHEAQNALLKILEEPPQSTNFVLILPIGLQLLPTVESRIAVYVQQTNDTAAYNEAFDEFCNSSLTERLSRIESNLKGKNVQWQLAIKQGLLNYVRHAPSEYLSEVEFVSRFLLTRGASNKFLLEHLALILPIRS